MTEGRCKYLSLAMLLAGLLFSAVRSAPQQDGTPGGSILQTQAHGDYKDEEGRDHHTVSEVVTITIQTVSALSVAPTETEPSVQIQHHQEFTSLFRICNGGNNAERVIVSKLEIAAPARVVNAYFDNDASGTLTSGDQELHLGETLSPELQPGACVGVLVISNSEDFPAHTNLPLRLTARSTTLSAANGIQEATGQVISSIAAAARLTGPDGGPPLLLVNTVPRAVATINQVITYSLSLRNAGDSEAQGINFVDDLPPGLEYLAGTITLHSKSGTAPKVAAVKAAAGPVKLDIPPLAPGASAQLEYQVRVTESVARGRGIVNFGIVSLENSTPAKTTDAVVLIDPFGIVFAGHGNGSTPIPGAIVALLTDPSGNTSVTLPAGAGFPPNTQNLNPTTADAEGRYNFAMLPEQLGTSSLPAIYYLRVSAPGYASRMLSVSLQPTHAGMFQATFTALDGQAIAEAGGFNLGTGSVTAEDLGSLAPNIPMFETHNLEIDKAVDKQRAEIGDVLSYTINIRNPGAVKISNLSLRDTLPPSFHYAAGTLRLQQANPAGGGESIYQPAEPATVNDEFTLPLGELAPAGQLQIKYRVRIGANAREGNAVNQAFVTGQYPNGEATRSDTARVSVSVGAGVFATRQIILGRVYEDVNANHYFDHDDRVIPGARIYLMNGQYVVTDAAGLYNCPAVGDGTVVIALDPVSVSPGLKLQDQGQVSGRSWARLLHTPLGGGSLLHQDFALVHVGGTPLPSAAKSLDQTRASNSLTATQLPVTDPDTPTAPHRTGTFEIAVSEKTAPVKPGEALIVDSANQAIRSSNSEIQVRVALDWTVLLEINGKPVSEKRIAETRVDHANRITTYTFAGLTLSPGPNEVRATAIGPKLERGIPAVVKVMGRGPVKRIEIVTERKELAAGGKDTMFATIRAWDQWDNPALDGQAVIEATNLLLLPLSGATAAGPSTPLPYANLPTLDRKGPDFVREAQANPLSANDARSQLSLALKDGEARVKLSAPGVAASGHLKVVMLQSVGELDLRILNEARPTLLVGLAEASFGSVPEPGATSSRYRGRLAFFFRTTIREQNILTLSYDSLRRLNHTPGQDRLFELDPLARAYPLFGDASTRFEAAQSNSKLYARLDHGRSYGMFGDFDADMKDLVLTGYSRKLTGVKLHLEDRAGSFITVTGARPDTAFARDVIPGGALSLAQLSFGNILPGSETVTLEVRDRRNPEVIISSEPLIRSVDYNLDPLTGQIFFLRFISTFDYSLNLTQIVVTYEHEANGLNTLVLTGRGLKKFAGVGLQLGFSGIVQRQDQLREFRLGGLDAQQRLPHGGTIKAAVSWSRGELSGFGGTTSVSNPTGANLTHDGFAYDVDYIQPVSFFSGVAHFRLAGASPDYLNPFGTTITAGSRRVEAAFSFKPRPSSTAKVAFTNERNNTERVANARSTFSFGWSEAVRENLKLNFGYDFRKFSDQQNDREIASNLFTVGAEWQATKKLGLSARREQNLGSSDPTYPNQTILGATYQLSDWARLFFTQRLASAPIVPIADTTGTGFGVSSTRSEMAFGVETKLSRFTSMTGRYQVDTGASTTDSFAVIGLVNRFPLNKQLSLELGYERGFHLKGLGKNFNSLTFGAAWQPKENFISNFRYELRDRNGNEHLFVIGAAGRINPSITALSRFQFGQTRNSGQETKLADGMAAVAIRPATSERMGLLFSYNRSARETTNAGAQPTRDRIDTLSADAFYQLTAGLELSGRFAARFNQNGQDQVPLVSTFTYLTQGRAQYRFARRFDLAGEMRAMFQPQSGTSNRSFGTELGYWALPDLRLAVGYNFSHAGEPQPGSNGGPRRGFYFNISTKLSNLFDLFGAARKEVSSGTGQAITKEERGSDR
jgi:uncharacterized repeat protein (TIGR01451 family)